MKALDFDFSESEDALEYAHDLYHANHEVLLEHWEYFKKQNECSNKGAFMFSMGFAMCEQVIKDRCSTMLKDIKSGGLNND